MSNPNAAFFKAMAAAQGEMKNIGFDKTNPHFKNRYASLAAVRDAVTPILAKHGLSVIQMPTSDVVDGKPYVGCRTIIGHSEGGYIEGSFVLPLVKPAPQDGGSALTYARRYAELAALNLVGDDDDDGNAASEPTRPTRATPAKESDSPGQRAMNAVRQWSGFGEDDIVEATKKTAKAAGVVIQGKMTGEQADKIVAFVNANKSKDFTKVVN